MVARTEGGDVMARNKARLIKSASVSVQQAE